MKINKLFSLEGLSRREIVLVLTCSLVFLLLQGIVVGLIPAQIVMVGLFLLLYFAHDYTRKMAVALLPFIAFEISYDWMRLYPNYLVNEVDTQAIYETERQLFGIGDGAKSIIPGEFFMSHHNAIADLMAGFFYLCWVPVPIAFGLYLFIKGKRRDYLRFALAFLFVNWLGFIGYYIHPTAPPWYVLQYGFEPDFSTPGNVAGLIRFDEMIDIPVFQSIYVNNSNIFAAVPSLHAAYMLIATIYSVISHRSWFCTTIFALITVGIWWTAVYSCHHYIIDVLLGIATACVGIALFEKLLMRWSVFSRFFNAYSRYIGENSVRG